MWKQNKKDFAREMGKLKTLKRKLTVLERRYLTEYQVRGSPPPNPRGWALLPGESSQKTPSQKEPRPLPDPPL